MRRWFWLIVGLMLLMVFRFPVTAQQDDLGITQNRTLDTTRLDDALQRTIAAGNLDGAALVLVKNGEVVYDSLQGRYQPGVDVPIASGSKWLTAAVVMSLVDDGAINLDNPVYVYLPFFTGDKADITVRMLLSHTSGLPADHACIRAGGITLEQCATQITASRVIALPGAQFIYGGTGFQVAGRVAEVAGGERFEVLLRDRILQPLDMPHTTFGQTDNPNLGGGARSTALDYAHFVQMLLQDGVYDGQQVLSLRAVHEMTTNHTRNRVVGFSPHPNRDTPYGLGNWIDRATLDGYTLVASSPGSTGFVPWIDREFGIAGVFVTVGNWHAVHPYVESLQQTSREVLAGR